MKELYGHYTDQCPRPGGGIALFRAQSESICVSHAAHHRLDSGGIFAPFGDLAIAPRRRSPHRVLRLTG